MKRAKDLYQKLISDENLRLAILTVNATHKWHPHHRPNKTVLRVEADIGGYVEKLREIIVNGYDAAPPRIARRWDKSAGKWRDISEPRLWPDQYVHHAVIQVLEPVLMRGMDKFCCGSIKGRGIHYGVKAIKKWMRTDPKGTKYAEELDIHHFYDSLTIETVMARLRRLVKDRRMLDVCERLMKYGVLIGAFFSQWFANTVLQPLDQMIRNSGLCDHYMRYMDNLTLFGRNKRKLRKLRAMRKHQKISPKLAQGLLSRLGQMKHCNHVHFFEKYVETGLQRKLKLVVREHTRKEQARWNMCTEPLKSTA